MDCCVSEERVRRGRMSVGVVGKRNGGLRGVGRGLVGFRGRCLGRVRNPFCVRVFGVFVYLVVWCREEGSLHGWWRWSSGDAIFGVYLLQVRARFRCLVSRVPRSIYFVLHEMSGIGFDGSRLKSSVCHSARWESKKSSGKMRCIHNRHLLKTCPSKINAETLKRRNS